MLLCAPALAASTGLRLHPRSSPVRAGLRLRQVDRVDRSDAAVASPEGVVWAYVTGTGGGRPAPAALLLDRRVRDASGSGNMRGTPARLYIEEEESTLLVALLPPLPLPPLVSLRLLRLPELLYPERGLTLLMEARPSRLNVAGLGLPGSDSGDVGAYTSGKKAKKQGRTRMSKG